MKKIVVNTETRRFLERAFEVSRKMVSASLNFHSDTELAQKIRALALQKGGILADPDETLTIFESNGDMVQTFGDRYRLVVERASGDVRVFIDGEQKHYYKEMSVAELMKEQKRLSLLSASR